MKIGIVGRKKDTYNYETFLAHMQVSYITSLTIGELSACRALLFPGGGDITPSLFGEQNKGSRNIDTELDLLQLRAFEQALKHNIPVFGICKGMQLINVGLGGTITQDLDTSLLHTSPSKDVYHETVTLADSFLSHLYGEHFYVNSRHHQAVNKLGDELVPVQWCPIDHQVEAFIHQTHPIIGVQWHPERLDSSHTTITGFPLFQYFLSFV